MVQKTITNSRSSLLLITVLVAAALLLCISLAQESHADANGTDGNIKWTFTEATNTLEVGLVSTDPNENHGVYYQDYNDLPWKAYHSDITTVIIQDQSGGIDEIGGRSFAYYPNLKEVSLPASVKGLYDEAFMYNYDLSYVYHPTGDCEVISEAEGVFSGCDDSILTFDVPADTLIAGFAKRNGYMIKGQKGSLEGAFVKEYYYGSNPYIVDDGFWYFTKQKYTGKARKPVPKVRLYGKYLKAGTDFTCTYKRNVNVGLATCTIKGKGDYCDENFYYFYIYPKGTSITKVTPAKKAATVKWKKQAQKMKTKRIDGYQVQIALNKAFTKSAKKYPVKGYKKTAKKIKSLKSKKVYYVRVRTYKTIYDHNMSQRLYSKWSSVKKVKVR